MTCAPAPALSWRQRQMLKGIAPFWRRADQVARFAGLLISYRAARRCCESLVRLGLAEAHIAQGGADFRLTEAGIVYRQTWRDQCAAEEAVNSSP